MVECKGCEEWESKYKDLLYNYRERGWTISKLKEELEKVTTNLNNANSTIEHELKPRTQREQRSYDAYVLDAGGDECFQNGMSGRCGFDCSCHGCKRECFENITPDGALRAYAEYPGNTYVLEIIDDLGLKDVARQMDIDSLKERILGKKEELCRLNRELDEILEDNINT